MARQVVLSLPWSPSVNTYWRSIMSGPLAGRVLISERGREYRKRVAEAVLVQRVPRGMLTGKLAIEIHALPPDRRARDLDNLLKGLLDSLHHAGVIEDDSEIDDLRIRRFAIRPGGELQVRISEIPGAATETGDLLAGASSVPFAKELLKARTMPNGAVLIDARQILIDLETEIMRISALTEELAEQGFVDPARLVFRYIEKLEAATTKMRTHQVIATAGALPAQR